MKKLWELQSRAVNVSNLVALLDIDQASTTEGRCKTLTLLDAGKDIGNHAKNQTEESQSVVEAAKVHTRLDHDLNHRILL